jgi:hypothetical protein
MENTELNYSGLILDENTISELDFLVWNWDDYKIPQNTNNQRHFYNQGELRRTRNACALYWCAWAISDLTSYKFSKDELLEIVDLAEAEYWWIEDFGMYMYKAVDCLRNWWNTKFPDDKLMTFRMTIWDEKFEEALRKWHSLVVWYRTSPEYLTDSQDNWEIEWDDFPKKWWHLVRVNQDTSIKIDDNYFGQKKFNTYINNKIVTLRANWVYFPSAYIFLKDTTMQDEIRANIDLERAKKMFDDGYWNWLNPRQPMSRQEVMTVLSRLSDKIDNIESYYSEYWMSPELLYKQK